MGSWEWTHAFLGGVATFVFLFQTLSGAFDDADSDGGFNLSDFSDYLSVRNFVAIFVGYGWITLAALLSGLPRVLSSLLGICAGLSLVFISLYLIKTFLKFQEDGTLDLKSLAGKQASVYITVGESTSSIGKVLVDTKAGRAELSARTDGRELLRPGSPVTILRADDSGVLWVIAKKEEL